jgi:hypothetical protein
MRFILFVLVLLVSGAGQLWADALVKNSAMSATTIAEYFVEKEGVTVKLEVGAADVEAYKNLLPDAIYQDMGFGDTPWSERLQQFFSNEFTIIVDEQTLPGRLQSIEPSYRIKRDEITGEPLPVEDKDAEQVISTTLFYPFENLPETIYLTKRISGSGSDVGFVLYHQGVAVNDFRYLSVGYQLNLDWQDPWYTSFNSKSLRRQYYAPMSGFLYVEPLEVRKEIIVRPKDLQRWIDLGLEGKEIISADQFDDIKTKVAKFLSQHQPVTIDGKHAEGFMDRINFLERTLTSSQVIEPAQDLDVDSAVIGAIFIYPVKALPDIVEMEWDLWDERIQTVSASAVDEAGPLGQYLQPDWNVLKWENFLKNPTVPTLSVIQLPPTAVAKAMLWLRWLFALVALLAVLMLVRKVTVGQGLCKGTVSVAIVAIGLTGLAMMLAKPAIALRDGEDQRVVSGLLHNIYRAFDFRAEGDIYDVLDKSVNGELLADIYLETRRGLVLANQGGARAKVKTIELTEVETQTLADRDGFAATATWVVTGSVGHWGHVHNRVNQYTAELDIEPVDGVWKVTGMKVLQEERL